MCRARVFVCGRLCGVVVCVEGYGDLLCRLLHYKQTDRCHEVCAAAAGPPQVSTRWGPHVGMWRPRIQREREKILEPQIVGRIKDECASRVAR